MLEDDWSSSSSASSARKQGKKRTIKTRAAQHYMEGRVHVDIQEQNALRGKKRNTRVGAVDHGGPAYRGGFGADITNRGVMGRVQYGEGSFRGGEEPKSVEGKVGPRKSTPSIGRAGRYARNDFVAETFANLYWVLTTSGAINGNKSKCMAKTSGWVLLVIGNPVTGPTFPRCTCRGRLDASRTPRSVAINCPKHCWWVIYPQRIICAPDVTVLHIS